LGGFQQLEQVCLVYLYKVSQVILQETIDVFGLLIGLQMVARSHQQFGSKGLEKLDPKLFGKPCVLV